MILQQLELTDQLTDAQKARFEGEAKFVRGYFYFLLARFFGGSVAPLYLFVAALVQGMGDARVLHLRAQPPEGGPEVRERVGVFDLGPQHPGCLRPIE